MQYAMINLVLPCHSILGEHPYQSYALRDMLLNGFLRNNTLIDEDVNERLQWLHVLLRNQVVVHADRAEMNEA